MPILLTYYELFPSIGTFSFQLETKIPEHVKFIEDKLCSLRQFLDELDELQQWLSTTKSVLETQGPISSIPSANDHDSLVLDAHVSAGSFISFFMCQYYSRNICKNVLYLIFFNILDSVIRRKK